MKNKSLKNLFILYLPAVIIPGLLKWLSIPVFTRILDIDQYANFALFIASIGMLSSINSWIGMSSIRFYPEFEKKSLNYSFTIAMLIYAMSFAVGIVIICAFSFLLLQGFGFTVPWFLILVGSIIFLCAEYSFLLLGISRIQQKIITYGIFNTWKAFSLLVLGALFSYYLHSNLIDLLIGYSIGLLVSIPFLHRTLLRDREYKKMKSSLIGFFKPSFFKTIFYFGTPLMLAELAIWGLRFSDRWLMGLLSGKLNLSIYDASYGVVEATILVIVSLFHLTIRPYEIKKWEDSSENEVKLLMTKMVGFYIITVLPISAIFIGLSDLLISILLPSEYSAGTLIIPWVVIAIFLLGLQQRIQSVLVYRKSTKGVATGAAIGLGVNLLLNILFIKEYGLLAASINTLIGYFLFCAFIFYKSKQMMSWRFPWILMFKVSIISIFILIGILFLKYTLKGVILNSVLLFFVCSIFAFLLYMICLMFLKEKSIIFIFLENRN